jgi:hypothetical protein
MVIEYSAENILKLISGFRLKTYLFEQRCCLAICIQVFWGGWVMIIMLS